MSTALFMRYTLQSRTKIYGGLLGEKKMETFDAQLQNATLLFTNYQHHFSSTAAALAN